ncbi:MAG: hypothetical protein MO852_04295 [Candidatus Devosia euplotis]|nr:hypothetical protein [Candidatus Devosia euplotis]
MGGDGFELQARDLGIARYQIEHRPFWRRHHGIAKLRTQTCQAQPVIGQDIAHSGPDHAHPCRLAQRRFDSKIGIQRLDHLAGLGVAAGFPVRIDPQQRSVAAVEVADQIQAQFVSATIDQCPRFKNPALPCQRVRNVGHPRRIEHPQRILRFAVGQIDHHQIDRDLRLGNAPQAVVQLIFQQFGRLRQQVHPDKPPRQIADHLIAARARRGQLPEIVIQPQSIDRPQRVRHAIEKQFAEHVLDLIAQGVDGRALGIARYRLLDGLKAQPAVAIAEIQFRQQLLHIRLKRIAVPQQRFCRQRLGGLDRVELVGIVKQAQRPVDDLGTGRPDFGGNHLAIGVDGFVNPALSFINPARQQMKQTAVFRIQAWKIDAVEHAFSHIGVTHFDGGAYRGKIEFVADSDRIIVDHRPGF